MSNNDDSYKQLISWSLNRQLTWGAVFFTMLSVFFNLFRPLNNSSLSDWYLVGLCIFTWIVIEIGVNRMVGLYKMVNRWENEINDPILRAEIDLARPRYHNYIIDENSEWTFFYLSSFIFFIFCILYYLLYIK